MACAPEKVPKKGKRNPRGLSVSWICFQVTPASTVMYMSCGLTSMMRVSREVSMMTLWSSIGRYPPVYDNPPPRGMTEYPACRARFNIAAQV